MKLPFIANRFNAFTFTMDQFDLWARTHKPDTIEMTDQQYAHLSNMLRFCPTQYGINGAAPIPFVFLDAPKSVV